MNSRTVKVDYKQFNNGQAESIMPDPIDRRIKIEHHEDRRCLYCALSFFIIFVIIVVFINQYGM